MMAAPQYSDREAIEAFRRAMEAAGLKTSDKIEGSTTDEITRFHVDGDKPKTRNGWYVLFLDGLPAGEFGCWKRGIRQTWTMERGGKELTPEERAEVEARLEASRNRREAAEKKRQGDAARLANQLLEAATFPAPENHPYLVRKGIRSHGVKFGRWTKTDPTTGEIWLDVPDALLVPIMTPAGKVVNTQAIFPGTHKKLGRDKDFLSGGRKRGCFYMIGSPKPGQTVFICEGFATGASIHEATGWCVVVAFDAGNLRPVAEALADAMPGHPFVIAADNDRWTHEPMENPGVHYATAAGKVINCRVVVPEFTSLDGEPTDFNDLAVREGAAEVVRQLVPALPIAANDNTTPEGGELAEVDRYDLPDQGGRGAVLPTVGNLEEICRRLRVTIRYNEITKTEEILIPGASYSVDNNARASLSWLRNECVLFRMPTDGMRGNILLLAEHNHFNPVVAWVTSKPWDGKDRLPELYETLTMADPSKNWFRDAMVRRWLITAIVAAFSPDGVNAQGALVLQGPQDLGKTTWMKNLVPHHLRLAAEGITLNPNDRDSVKQAVGFWLVELGELDATFRKADLAQLKAFLTRQQDIFRKAYAEDDSHFARRTAFFGSVNPEQFLHDPTGNRRFWTLAVKAVDYLHKHIDMQQVWAQVLALVESGETHYLTPEEKAEVNAQNERFQVIDPVEERLQTRLEWGVDVQYWTWRTATDSLMAIGMDRPTQSDCTKASAIIKKLNGGHAKRTGGKNLLLVPPVVRVMDRGERPGRDVPDEGGPPF